MAFGAFAAIVQLAIGITIVWRNPRNERLALFGLLFILNGIIAALTFAGTGFPEIRDRIAENGTPLALGFLRSALFFENCTNLLLLLIAFIYPRRARWLRRAPHGVILFAAIVGALFVARLVFGDELLVGRRESWPLTGVVAAVSYGAFDLAFPLIMLRWAVLWREDWSDEMRAQFALIFAAIGSRAVHQMMFVPFTEVADVLDGREATTAGLMIGGTLVAINMLALVVSLGMILAATRRLTGKARSWHYLLLAFLAFGALEGIVNTVLKRGFSVRWWHAITGKFDVLVIRPVLVWFAITRTHFLDVRLRSGRLSWSMAFVLTAAAATGGVYEAFGANGSPAVQWALSALIGIAVASIVLAVAQSVILARSEAWSRPPTPQEVYASQLDEAYRNGPPSLANETRLARLRAQLGIDERMHRDLEKRLLAQSPSAISERNK